ncbi:hypothetical protein J8C06_11180 [Chloracidobacterium validum]|uniref:Gingipain domain-containing protein n=1 Tax=Chloracidobacterium validum TaxID=2821543 RepID=A0ABX8BBP4_9BACT|nr:C25 family cysteine peptidase [Chloracidobacterium validum]QUW04357.1 hypothetical protein J8C06_11180 [Chloracidobacterium validum]
MTTPEKILQRSLKQWAVRLLACASVAFAFLLAVRPPLSRQAVHAAKTPLNAQMITVRDSGAPIGNGDFVGCSTSPGLNTYYAVFIEVPDGTSRLTIDLFDADYGLATNAFDNRVGGSSDTQFSLRDPAGTSIPLNTVLSGTGLNFDRGTNTGTGTNGPDTRVANDQWKNFYTVASPAAGHWELRIVQPGGGDSGVNPFGVAAHTLDPGANRDQNLGGPTTGRGLNMYFDPGIHLGPQTPGRTPPITWNYYPYITSGCDCRANEFDWDATGGTGTIAFTSRTGGYTFSTSTVSPNNEWRSNLVGSWTTSTSAIDYGIWQNNITINTGSNNHITYYIGDYSAVVPNTSGSNILPADWRRGDKFRVYFPGDAGATTAPLKPYMTQRLFYIGATGNGPNPPCAPQTSFYRVRVDIVNPTDYDIVLDGTTIGTRVRRVQANIPNVPGISYANETTYGGAQVTQGTFTQPADGATSGSVLWTPGTIAANGGASLFYVIRVAPTVSSPCNMAVTGSPGGAVEGTTAVWLDETGNTSQERATYTFGPLCALSVNRAGACTGCGGSAPPTPTKVDLRDASATRYPTGTNIITWSTGYETNHLGFHLWRDTGGKRERVTPELIAGSALITTDTLTAGQHYVWRDDDRRLARTPVNYWLEAYDLDGSRQWYGPLSLREVREPLPLHLRNSPLLGHGTASAGRQFEALPTTQPALTNTVSSKQALKASAYLATQQWLAGRPAAKLHVAQTGWQRVTRAALQAAGFSPLGNEANWQLYVQGQEVPLRVTPEGIEFYGVAADTLDSGEQAYWLTEGDRPGRRVRTEAASPALRPTVSHFTSAVTRADKSVYFAALLNGDEDNFFGSIVTTTPVAQTLLVRDPLPTSGEPIQVTVELQGVSLDAHVVSVTWNGQPLGVISYTGRTVGRGVWQLPADQVLDGTNTLTLQAQTSGDVNLVKSMTVSYARRLRAADDRLAIQVPQAGAGRGWHVLSVEGFTTAARAFDVTDAGAPLELPVRMSGGVAQLAVRPGRQVIVTTPAAMWMPRVEVNQPSHWYRRDQGAEFVILTHATFRPAAERLAVARRAEGLGTVVVDITDVYDEWSYGVKSAAAVRDFLRHAATDWARPVRYALLVGNATFDPRDYLGFGGNVIPTKLIGVGSLETAVDDWLGDMNDSGIARVSVGRLPVKTPAEAELLVAKSLAYEQAGPADWKRRALVVADNPDEGGDFDAAASDVLGLLPDPTQVTPIRVSTLGAGGARAALLAGLNTGAGLVNYIGHGSTQNWAAENLLTSGDAAGLGNVGRAGLVVSMTCLTGFHHDVYTTALGKALVLASGGATAVWSSSALTPSDGQHWANVALLEAMYGPAPTQRLGDAIRQAKQASGDVDVRRSWTLLGDPTLRLR